MMRTVIVGDVHGCGEELERLLAHIGFGQGDRLILVGDLVARGPEPRRVLELLRACGGRAVRGNHEDKLLRWYAAHRRGVSMPLGPAHRETVRVLRERDWALLADFPLWLDLPDHGVRVVHAGLVPGLSISKQSPRTLMFVRCLDAAGEPVERRDGGVTPWAARYEGPPQIVFGHNALSEPRAYPWATGIDTGCVYGGRLTAMVLRSGEHPPNAERRLDVLVSVPARRAYFPR